MGDVRLSCGMQAPEVLMGQRYDSRADLWSVGTILYQCLMGAAPFTAPNPHALRRKYEKGQLVPRYVRW